MRNITPRSVLEGVTWSGVYWYVRCGRIRCNNTIPVNTSPDREYTYTTNTIVVSKNDWTMAACSFKCLPSVAKRFED